MREWIRYSKLAPEGFFRELGAGLAAGRSEVDLRSELAGKYDSEPVK